MRPRTHGYPLSISVAAAWALASPLASAEYTLELLHAADQEAGIAAIVDAPSFSAVLQALKDQDLGNDAVADNTLVLSSGDAIIPGVFFNASNDVFGGAGYADIAIQNELGFEAIALGNHEFDQGTSALAGLIAGDGLGFSGTAFPYLSANLDFSTDADLAGLVVADADFPLSNSLAASTVIDVNGEPIGVVGATTPTLDVISNPGDVTVLPDRFDGVPSDAQLDALAVEIQADVDALLAANPTVNKVILLAHMQQITIEQALAHRLRDVDIIVAGGSNTRLFDGNDRPRDGDSVQGTYPIFAGDVDGNPVAIVNTDGNYKYVGRLVITFDDFGVIIPASYDEMISGAYPTDAQGVTEVGGDGLQDPEIQAIVDMIEQRIVELESNVFGITEFFLNGTRGDVRTQETNLGNLSADANLAAAKEYDASVRVSLKNGGGIRDNIGVTLIPPGGTTNDVLKLPPEEIPGVKPEGGISQTDIANALRFNNGLTLLTLTAEQLRAVLEHGFAASGAIQNPDGSFAYDFSNTQGRFPQLAGLSLAWDPRLPSGQRIVSAAIQDDDGSVVDRLVIQGELVGEASRQIRIVTLNFLAGGGDGYPFPDGPQTDRVDLALAEDDTRTGAAVFAEDGSEQDALAEYLAANFSAIAYAQQDQDIADDERIQNLMFRENGLIPVLTDRSDCSGQGWRHVYRQDGSGFRNRIECRGHATEQRLRDKAQSIQERLESKGQAIKDKGEALRERLQGLEQRIRDRVNERRAARS